MATRKRHRNNKNSFSIPMLIILFVIFVGFLFAADCEFGFTIIPSGDLTEVDSSEMVDSNVSVHYINVEQGDCCLIVAGNTTVLVDAGEKQYSQNVIDYIKELKIKKLDYIVATHPHSDHIGGIPDVMSQFEVGKVIMPKITGSMVPTTKTYENLIKAIKSKGIKAAAAKPQLEYTLDVSENETAKITFLAPVNSSYDSINNYSAVFRLDYKDVSFLFTGDAEDTSEYEMIDAKENLYADVLKVGHHGSSTSSTDKFLARVKPKVCIISVGAGNKYGHPHTETVKRLQEYTDKIYRTDINGNIIIKTDGKKLSAVCNNQ